MSTPIINAGAPSGTYTATIRALGASGGGERTATVQVVVGPATTGNVTEPTASVAWVTIDSSVARTTVYNATQAEITAPAGSNCTLYPNGSTRNAIGTVTGLTASQQSLLGMGWWFRSPSIRRLERGRTIRC